MSTPTTRQAYPDIYALLDRALAAPNGLRVKVADHDKAVFLRMRIHQARQIDRNDNAQIYSPGEPLFAASQYDRFQIRIRVDREADCAWLMIEPRTADILAIENLSPSETPELLTWNNEEQNSPPQLISPTGTEPSVKRLEYSSSAPSGGSSSTPSTKPDEEPPTPSLRRL